MMVFPIQAKLDSAVFSAVFAFLLRRRERKEPWGARFSEVPVTFGARDQIFKSKYKE